MRERFFRRLHSRGERGQAMVEFALVSIVFFILFFGVFDGVRLLQSWVTVQHAARESARYAITGRTGCNDAGEGFGIIDRDACITWTAKNATTGISRGGPNANDADVIVTYMAWDYTGTDWSAGGVSSATGKPCDQIEVTVKYKHHFVTPIIKAIVPGGMELTGRQRMTNEPWGPCEGSDGVRYGG